MKTKHIKKTVKVVKTNTRYITKSEWNCLKTGMSPSKVQSIFGNKGYRYYTSGSKVIWAFDDIYADGSSYDTYYLVFRNGAMYAR